MDLQMSAPHPQQCICTSVSSDNHPLLVLMPAAMLDACRSCRHWLALTWTLQHCALHSSDWRVCSRRSSREGHLQPLCTYCAATTGKLQWQTRTAFVTPIRVDIV